MSEPGNFYVSVIDAGRTGLLAGPFTEHANALALVDRAQELAIAANPWAHFYAYGTVKMPADYRKPGLFNNQLGVTE